jgi:hypothetical protein
MSAHMPDHTGSWWSYPVYAAGIVIGAMSPQDWLIALSLLAVVIRIITDLPAFIGTFSKLAAKIKEWRNGR